MCRVSYADRLPRPSLLVGAGGHQHLYLRTGAQQHVDDAEGDEVMVEGQDSLVRAGELLNAALARSRAFDEPRVASAICGQRSRSSRQTCCQASGVFQKVGQLAIQSDRGAALPVARSSRAPITLPVAVDLMPRTARTACSPRLSRSGAPPTTRDQRVAEQA